MPPLLQSFFTSALVLTIASASAIAAPLTANSEAEGPIRFIDASGDSRFTLDTPISRGEYIYLLHEGLVKYQERRQAAYQTVDAQCQYAASSSQLMVSRAVAFQREAHQTMATIRAAMESNAKQTPLAPAAKSQPPHEAELETTLVNDLRRNWGIDLSQPDGTFAGDRWLSYRAFLDFTNTLLNYQLAQAAPADDALPLPVEEGYRDLKGLAEDLSVARELLAQLRAAAQPLLLKGLQPAHSRSGVAIAANSTTWPMSDYTDSDPVYAFAARFMDDFGIDLRIDGSVLAPNAPLTYAQFLDDAGEVVAVLNIMLAVDYCGSEPAVGEEFAALRSLSPWRADVQATAFDIRALIGEVQQAVTAD